jgi:hypothetical protein
MIPNQLRAEQKERDDAQTSRGVQQKPGILLSPFHVSYSGVGPRPRDRVAVGDEEGDRMEGRRTMKEHRASAVFGTSDEEAETSILSRLTFFGHQPFRLVSHRYRTPEHYDPLQFLRPRVARG